MVLARSSRLLLAAIAVAACLVSVTSSARAAAPGVVTDVTSDNATLGAISSSGAQWVRSFLTWDRAEPTKGHFDQSFINGYQQMAGKLPTGTKLEVVVTNAPSWANGGAGPTTPPTNPADLAAFFTKVVGDLKGSVAAWEVWNEEDAGIFWAGTPDPARYASMLKAAYPAIKAADPSATVILGGLTGNDYNYLEQVYGAGGGGSFDAVAVHTDTACGIVSPYSYYRDNGRISQWSFLGYREVHATMAAHGDGAKPIWMTELGWSTTTAICDQGQWAGQKAGGVSQSDQATFLKQAYHCLAGDSYVPVAIWFNLANLGAADTPFNRYGLMDQALNPKPAFAAFQDVAAHGDTLTGPCGDFVAPQVTVSAPTEGAMFPAELPITVSATDASGVARITLAADGQQIRNFTDATAPAKLSGSMTWQGAKTLALGPHTLTVTAVDPAGNVGTVDVHVTKVTPGKLPPIKTTTTLKRGKARGGKLSFSARVRPAVKVPRVPGKVQLLFAKKVKGKWKVAHKYTKPAKATARVTVKLERALWRIQAVYRNEKPFLASKSRAVTLRVG
jgi:Bacterial Ig domain